MDNLNLDLFQNFMAPEESHHLSQGLDEFSDPPTEYNRQLDLPTSSSAIDSFDMFSEPMESLEYYDLDFPFESEVDTFSQFDQSSLLTGDSSSLLNSESSLRQSHQHCSISDLISSYCDSEGEININTSSYITPDEIDKFEKSFPMPGVKSKLKDLLGTEDLFGGEISEDSDIEEGEIVDNACPAPKTTKHFVAKCAQGSKDPLPLPEGWVQVWHKSGIQVYMHTSTRIVTLSRPYFLPHARNIRTHFIPVDSVPCMKEWMFGKKDGVSVLEQKCGIKNIKELQTISFDKFQVYLRELWDFEEAVVENYQKGHNKKRPLRNPDVVEIEIPKELRENNKNRDVWRVNMANKTPAALIEEYTMLLLKSKAEFAFRELTDSKKPFLCTIILNGVKYASESGTSKKVAKQQASEATLKLLCPELYRKFHNFKNSKTTNLDKNVGGLYKISIDDESAMEKLNEAGLPRPFQILKQCLQKKMVVDQKPEFEVKQRENNSFEISLVIDKYKASVDCKNKRIGKNVVSQKILKQMYPSLSLGALIDLQTNISLSKDKKDMPTPAQCRQLVMGAQHQRKTKLLDILRSEMLKISEQLQQGKPISEKYAKLEP